MSNAVVQPTGRMHNQHNRVDRDEARRLLLRKLSVAHAEIHKCVHVHVCKDDHAVGPFEKHTKCTGRDNTITIECTCIADETPVEAISLHLLTDLAKHGCQANRSNRCDKLDVISHGCPPTRYTDKEMLFHVRFRDSRQKIYKLRLCNAYEGIVLYGNGIKNHMQSPNVIRVNLINSMILSSSIALRDARLVQPTHPQVEIFALRAITPRLSKLPITPPYSVFTS